MEKDELEKEIKRIHDAIIRLEPVCEKVEKHDRTLYNNGWGIAAQVKVLWVVIPSAWALFLVYIKHKN